MVQTGVGLHARPAALLVKEAARHACKITICHGSRSADAKSILQVLGLGVKDGAEVTLYAEGEGAESALRSLRELVENGLR